MSIMKGGKTFIGCELDARDRRTLEKLVERWREASVSQTIRKLIREAGHKEGIPGA